MNIFIVAVFGVAGVLMLFATKLLPKMIPAEMSAQYRERLTKRSKVLYYSLGIFFLLMAIFFALIT